MLVVVIFASLTEGAETLIERHLIRIAIDNLFSLGIRLGSCSPFKIAIELNK